MFYVSVLSIKRCRGQMIPAGTLWVDVDDICDLKESRTQKNKVILVIWSLVWIFKCWNWEFTVDNPFFFFFLFAEKVVSICNLKTCVNLLSLLPKLINWCLILTKRGKNYQKFQLFLEKVDVSNDLIPSILTNKQLFLTQRTWNVYLKETDSNKLLKLSSLSLI